MKILMPRALVVGHTDGHGVAATAISIKNLEKEGYKVKHICRFPDTGVIPKFWKETIDKIIDEADEYDVVVLVDIPLDRMNYEESSDKLAKLCRKKKTYFIDHHPTPKDVIEKLEKAGCIVKVKTNALETVYGEPDEKWSKVGAICDRDRSVKDVRDEKLLTLADGLDVLVRKDIEKAIDSILKDDEKTILEQSRSVPDPHDVKIIGDVVIVEDVIPEGWKFKVLDKACRKTGKPYAAYLSENQPDRTTGEPRDFVTVIRFWQSEKPSVRSVLPEELERVAVGHPDAVTISLEVGRGKEVLESIVKSLNRK